MPRKLKVFQTSIGFHDLAIAAPSMKAALEAWGAGSNLFHQGAASETRDAKTVAAAMKRPGVVLKRPVGSNKAFAEAADIPDQTLGGRPSTARKGRKGKTRRPDQAADRKAAAAYERQQRRDEKARARAEAAERKVSERREAAVAAAQRALNEAARKHETRLAKLGTARDEIDHRIETENAAWDARRSRLESAIRKAKAI